MAKKTVGTHKTEVIIGAAANKLSKAVADARAAIEAATGLEAVIEENTIKVSDLENKIASLETSYAQKKSEQEFNLDMEFKTNQKKFVEDFLRSENLVSVPKDKYEGQVSELEALKANMDQKIATEVAKVASSKDAQLKSEKALMESEYKAREAGNLAKIESLEERLEFANQQTKMWKEALDAERTAGVDRAKASAVGAVNITPAGSR